MTTPAQTPIERFTASGSQTVFPVTAFGADASSEIIVLLNTILQTEGIDYLITSLTPLSFNVDFSPAADPTPTAGTIVTAYRRTEPTQETDYQEGDDFPAESHEAALDKLTRAHQDTERRLGAMPELHPSLVPGSLSLPSGNKFLRMSADGLSLTGVDNITFTGIPANDILNAIQALGVGVASRIIRFVDGDTAELIHHGPVAAAFGALVAGFEGGIPKLLSSTTATLLTTHGLFFTSDVAIDNSFDNSVIVVDATAGPVTVTLPAISVATDGYFVTVKKRDISANAVTVQKNAADGAIIEGATSVVLTAPSESVRIVRRFNGVEWNTIRTISPTSINPNLQVFTASGTWTRPAGITRVLVLAIGGGGGGGGCASPPGGSIAGGGGGAGGALALTFLNVSSIPSATVTIGAAGAGGAAGNNAGAAGGTTSWADGTNTITCPGGGGGPGGASDSVANWHNISTDSAGGDATGALVNGRGWNGARAYGQANTNSVRSGEGANGLFGRGGASRALVSSASLAGNNSSGFGAGGSGAASAGAAAAAGGNGTAGLLLVLELA